MKKLACGLVLALSLRGGLARGADWTFNVRVDVDAIHPDVDKVFVQCDVAPDTNFGPGNRIQSTVETPLLPNRSYHGTVVVTSSVPAGKDPATEKFFQCGLLLKSKKSASDFQWPRQGADIEVWRRAKDGAPFKMTIAGSLP